MTWKKAGPGWYTREDGAEVIREDGRRWVAYPPNHHAEPMGPYPSLDDAKQAIESGVAIR